MKEEAARVQREERKQEEERKRQEEAAKPKLPDRPPEELFAEA